MKFAFGGKDHKFDEALARWVFKRTDPSSTPTLVPGMYYAIGVVDSTNKLIAGIVYTNYSKIGEGGKIEMSLAADNPKWCQRGIIAGLLHYPFIQQNCHVIIAMMKLKNRRVRRLAEGIGFKVVGKINHWPYAEDVIVYSLRREDAKKWIFPVEERRAA